MTDKNESQNNESSAISSDDPRLTAFVLGELDSAETEKIQGAINGSPELAAAVDETRQMIDMLGSAYGTEEPVRLLDEQHAALAGASANDSVLMDSHFEISGGTRADDLGASSGSMERLSVPAKKNPSAKTAGSRKRSWLPIAIAASLLGLMAGGAWYLNGPGSHNLSSNVASAMKTQEQESAKAPEAKRKADSTADRFELERGNLADQTTGDTAPASDVRDQAKSENEAWSDRDSVDGMDQIVAAKNSEYKIQANGTRVPEEEAKQKIESMEDGVMKFNELVDQENYSAAMEVADEVNEIAPGNEIAELMQEKAKLLRRDGRMEATQEAMESGFWESMQSKREASMPGDKKEDVDAPFTPLGSATQLQEGKFLADQSFGGSSSIGLHVDTPEIQPVQPTDSEMVSSEKFLMESGRSSEQLILSEEDRIRIESMRNSRGPSTRPAEGLKAEMESQAELSSLEKSAVSASSGGLAQRGGGMGGMGAGGGRGAGGGLEGMERPSDEVLDLVEADDESKEEEVVGEFTRREKNVARRKNTSFPASPMQQGQSGEQDQGQSEGDGENGGGDQGEDDKSGENNQPGFDDDSENEKGLGGSAGNMPAKENTLKADAIIANSATESSGQDELSRLARESGERSIGKKLAELSELEALGVQANTAMVPQTKTRTVPTQRMRKESRTRSVVIDGKSVQQHYEVEVPYTENITQNYTVEAPQTILSIDARKSRELVERLTKRVDPNGKQTFELPQLFDMLAEEATKEVDDLDRNDTKNDQEESGGEEQDLRLAIILRDTLKQAEAKNIDTARITQVLKRELKKRNAKVLQNRSWKRVKATPNTTRLMIGDKDELDMSGMQVKVQVDGFRARVLIDCFYYNDRDQQLEGNFKLRLPDDTSLYYFAFGESVFDLDPKKGGIAQEEFLDDGTQFVSLGAPEIKKARANVWANVKESRMVPKEKAAHAFRETVRRKVDPALVEWSGAGVFNASVFPLAPHKLHRIVIGYDVNLKKENSDLIYELGLPEQTGQCEIDINIQPVDGYNYSMVPKSDPIQENVGGKVLRRYRFTGPQPNGIRLKASPIEIANETAPILLHSNNKAEGDFWGVQVTPDLPVERLAGNPHAIFMLDTSLSSNPDKFNVWLKMLETTLNTNRDSLKQFNVAFFNVDTHLWQDKWVDNTPVNVDAILHKCNTLALEGATDLYGAIEHLKTQKWINVNSSESKDSKSPRPDLFLLSDGAANWGETNMRLIGRQLEQSNFGSMFAYQSGFTGTAIANLRFLAGETGGAVFSVATEAEIKTAATAHRKRPWKLNSLVADGATDLMTAGRVKWVYPDQTITVVGRGTVTDEIKLEMTQGASGKTISVSPVKVESELASRLYGQIAVGQLESLGAKVFDVAASYARHFRVTGDTCSLLMLESEADYQRFNIKPEEDIFVIKTKAAKDLVAGTLRRSASELADPKAQLEAWLVRLESMPGMQFKMPTALKLAMEEIKVDAISKPLDCLLTTKEGLSNDYLTHLSQERLDYDLIATEANRRGGSSVDEAIKVFSSLVERNPGNLEISRDVAFTAMEMGRPAQAFHLLRKVAHARPFEGSIYPALGQCLSQLGQADQAIVYYEIALGGSFARCGASFKEIVSADYAYLLRRVCSGELESSIPDFAKARLDTLKKEMRFNESNLVITMLWNTDQTDVDLHVTEPSGEECSYENKRTRSGGQITEDITTGFGPEMYSNTKAPIGKYDIKVKYFRNRQNRTELRNKVHLLIYRGFGTDKEQLIRRTVQLKTVGNKESVATIGVD